jgi:type I restriction enzyme S subunit
MTKSIIALWKKERLDDVCILVTDGTHDTPEVVPEGFPLVKGKDISNGYIDFENCDRISEDEHRHIIKRSKPERGDVLFANIGNSIGDCVFVDSDREFSIKNVALFKPNVNQVHPKYLFYVTSGDQFIGEILSAKSGAAQPFVSLAMLRRHEISVPPLQTQQKIAHILSAYDDLIENNLKRINLLEEMAQITYEQWFVRMKFPGHETTPIDSETGLPEGWGTWSLDKLITIKHGYAYKGEFFRDEATNRVLLTPGNFKIGGGLKLDKIKYYDEAAECPEGYILGKHDLLVTMTDLSKMADTLGYPLLVPTTKARTYLHNQRLGKVIPVGGINFPKFFYYMLFQDERYRAFVVGSSSGATVKHTSPSKILAFKPKLPPVGSDLIIKFDKFLEPIFEFTDRLLQENELLSNARDILLPRLMTGLINVDHIELPTAEQDTEAA